MKTCTLSFINLYGDPSGGQWGSHNYFKQLKYEFFGFKTTTKVKLFSLDLPVTLISTREKCTLKIVNQKTIK